MTNVYFLGTGGAFSAGHRSNLALLIESGEFRMLIETGPMIMHQLHQTGIQVMDIEHVFISHAHGDHALGFPMFALNRLGIDASAPAFHVYTSAGAIASLKALWEIAYAGFDIQRLNIHWHPLPNQEPRQTRLTDAITLHTAPVPHPPNTPTLAARWDFEAGPSIAFVTDTYPNETTVALAEDCDLLIHEASFSATLQPDADANVHFHSTAQQAGQIARKAGAKRLALVHLGPMIGRHPDVLIEEARAGTDLDVFVLDDGGLLQIKKGE